MSVSHSVPVREIYEYSNTACDPAVPVLAETNSVF